MCGKRVINLKKFSLITLITIIITTFFTISANANNKNYETEKIDWSPSGIKMAVDGKEITFPDQKPLLDAQAGRTYIPIRFLAEALGADVDWINEHQVVEIVNKGIEGENTKIVYYLKMLEHCNKLFIKIQVAFQEHLAHYFMVLQLIRN